MQSEDKVINDKPRVLFGRKINNIDELQELTNYAKREGKRGTLYEVTKEVLLSNKEFQKFASDFFNEQPWIDKSDGGSNEKGEIRCIRVINTETGQRVLINSEGYDYWIVNTKSDNFLKGISFKFYRRLVA